MCAALAFPSVATPILGALVALGRLGLAVMAWAEQGSIAEGEKDAPPAAYSLQGTTLRRRQ